MASLYFSRVKAKPERFTIGVIASISGSDVTVTIAPTATIVREYDYIYEGATEVGCVTAVTHSATTVVITLSSVTGLAPADTIYGVRYNGGFSLLQTDAPSNGDANIKPFAYTVSDDHSWVLRYRDDRPYRTFGSSTSERVGIQRITSNGTGILAGATDYFYSSDFTSISNKYRNGDIIKIFNASTAANNGIYSLTGGNTTARVPYSNSGAVTEAASGIIALLIPKNVYALGGALAIYSRDGSEQPGFNLFFDDIYFEGVLWNNLQTLPSIDTLYQQFATKLSQIGAI